MSAISRSRRITASLLLSLCVCSLVLVTPSLASTPPPQQPEQQPPVDDPPSLLSEYTGPTRDSEPWVFPLTQLIQRIVRLPYVPSSASTALSLIAAFRGPSGPLEARDADSDFEWGYQVPRVRISRLESRSFPDSLSIQRSRPWPAAEVPVSALPPESEGADEGPDMSEADVDDGIDSARPRIVRPNLMHVLAARGFDAAIAEVLSLLSADAAHAAVSSVASLQATLQLDGATPLHLLALYAPDDESESNVRAARLLVSAGANVSAEIASAEGGLSALVFAAERGHDRLFASLLSASLPPSYLRPASDLPRSPAEQRALDEWSFHRRRIVDEHATGLPLRGADGGDADWAEYIAWYDSQRPLSAVEQTHSAFQSQLLRALQLAALADRQSIVRSLLDGPGDGYGLRARLNERSHGGRGDTLIHGCIVHGLTEMAELIVDHGADLSVRTHDQLTALQLALQYKQFSMQKWIEDKLRQIRPPTKAVRLDEHGTDEETAAHAHSKQAADGKADTAEPTSQAPAADPATSPPSKYQQAKDKSKQKKQAKQQQAAQPHDEL